MITVRKSETLFIRTEEDIVHARRMAREWSAEIGFGIVDQTRIVTAASELARNTLDYGMGGQVEFQALLDESRRGIRLIFEDQGPGIPDLELAMRDGYTTGGGLGLGLSGSRRLMSTLEVEPRERGGTRVTATRWRG